MHLHERLKGSRKIKGKKLYNNNNVIYFSKLFEPIYEPTY